MDCLEYVSMLGSTWCRKFSFVTIASASMVLSHHVAAAPLMQLDVRSQPLANALAAVGNLTGVNVIFDPALLSNLKSSALKGAYSPADAFAKVLGGTDLRVVFVDDHTVSIVSKRDFDRHQTSTIGQGNYSPEFKKIASTRSGVADSVSDVGVSSAENPEGGGSQGTEMRGVRNDEEEVLVTAQKRTERLQDVPVPVTAIDANSLINSNQKRLQDYFVKIPGLSITPAGGGEFKLTVRGVATGSGGNPTVGVTIDDVPYGASTSLGGGGAAVDIDPSDLQRVEMLRGPQGTLYGVSSIGGLLKYVTVDPTTERVSGHIQSEVLSVHNGTGLGYGFRAGINLPVTDSLAVRLSGFARREPGYIDNVLTGQNGINRQDASGGRASLLWRASDSVNLKLSAMLQNTTGDGSDQISSELGDLQQDLVRGIGGYNRRIQAYSAILNAKAGPFDIVFNSGYSINKFSDSFDYTKALGDCCTLPTFGVLGTAGFERNTTRKTTEELRLSAPLGLHFDWLIGGFYTHENNEFTANLLALEPSTGAIAGTWLDLDSFPTTLEEYAVFTDLTYKLSDRFDIQVGARESHNNQTYSEQLVGSNYDLLLIGLPSPIINPETKSSENSFTYLVTPRIKLSPDLMIYARLTSGYRAGGPNSVATVFNLPLTYKPDKTENYELGLKGNFFDRRLNVDSSIYYTTWKDIQLSVVDPTSLQSYTANGSRAKSEGIEISAEAKPISGLSLSSWLSYGRADLTQGFPATASAVGFAGARLPNSPRISGHLSADWDFPISGNLLGVFGADVSYVGNKIGEFTSSAERQYFGGYAVSDLRAGVRRETLDVTVSVNNIADRRGPLSGGIGTTVPVYFTYIRPREVDLSVSYRF